jgi:hypothetical protein
MISPITNAVQGKIVVLLPTAFSVRNVVYSGVLEALVAENVEVDLLLHNCSSSNELPELSAFKGASSCRPMSPPIGRQIKGRPFINGVIKKAFSKRNDIASYSLYRNWFERNYTKTERFRSASTEGFGTLAQPKPILETLAKVSEYLYRRGYDLSSIRNNLRRLAPDFVWSTMCACALEYPYFLAARDLKIPVVTSILSFDNLTSRSLLPTYDHYLVWSERMRSQLLRLYPDVSHDQVSITGTPQFDFHCKPELIWSRNRTCDWLALPGNARYFLYAASHESLAPAEPGLVTTIAQTMEADPVLKKFHLVVRLHPHDDGSRWHDVSKQSKLVALSRVCGPSSAIDGWQMPTSDDHSLLISSLLHSEACLNIVSTMALDAAILDRPVIGIDFASEPNSPKEIMYEEYGTDHYAPLVKSGGLSLAHNWSELISLMRNALVAPEENRKQRVAMVRAECGSVDGHAWERVASTLVRLVRKGVPATEVQREAQQNIAIPQPRTADLSSQHSATQASYLKNAGA